MGTGSEEIDVTIQGQPQCHPPGTFTLQFLGDLVQSLTPLKFHPHCERAEHPCPLLTLLPEEPGLRLEDGHQDISREMEFSGELEGPQSCAEGGVGGQPGGA